MRIFHYIFEKARKLVIKREYFIMPDTFKTIFKDILRGLLKYRSLCLNNIHHRK